MATIAAGLVPAAALVLSAAAVSPPQPSPQPLHRPPSHRPATHHPPSQPRSHGSPAVPLHSPTGAPGLAGARASGGGAGPPRVTPREGWQWPLSPTPAVTRGFRAPQSQWGAGHRGVDLAALAGQPVLAASSGRVTHVGAIAGRGTVTVLHRGGVRTTYEPVLARVRRGEVVEAGQVLGIVDGDSHCGTCLHLGALRGRVYLDPLMLLGRRRVVLLPWVGSQAPSG